MLRISRNTVFNKAFAYLRFISLKLIIKNLKLGKIGLVGADNTIVIKYRSSFGDKFITADNVELIAIGEIKIGNNVCINSFSRIVSHKSIQIGNDVTFAKFVSILDHDHLYQFENNELKLDGFISQKIVIGDNVWVGDKVTILKGVTIGSNVIIGANSVINKSIPSNSVAAGVPAKVIKKVYE